MFGEYDSLFCNYEIDKIIEKIKKENLYNKIFNIRYRYLELYYDFDDNKKVNLLVLVLYCGNIDVMKFLLDNGVV